MFAKLALPLLGGTPSVWNTALVFFQAALLVGYGYAHATTRWLTLRAQITAHIALAGLSCLSLPLQLRVIGDPPVGAGAVPWLVLVFTLSLGLPFAVLASGAPLLQRWFAASGHPEAHDPYFLYAASNVGSLCALLSYPLLVEPWFTLGVQRSAWSVGYVLVMVLVASCALSVRGSAVDMRATTDRSVEPLERVRVTARDRVRWLVYAAVPSSLLMGATTYVSTDVAAMPLLWVVPLSLYLLTFVLAFAKREVIPHAWLLRIEPYLLILAAVQFFLAAKLPGLLLPVLFHFGLLFVVSLVCHGELARRRPAASVLTEFFLWISVGGLVGGVFNALVAPVLFDEVVEYALVLALAGFLRPSIAVAYAGAKADASPLAAGRRLGDLALPLVMLALLAATRLLTVPNEQAHFAMNLVVAGSAALALLGSAGRPMRFGLGLIAVLVAGRAIDLRGGESSVIRRGRSFFGVYRVTQTADGSLRTLVHGTTVHGTQWLDSARRLDPLTYYHRAGPMGDFFSVVPAATATGRRVAVVGLGIGSLACYGRRGESWTYYEIDPLVVDIARDTASFTMLRDCPPTVRIVLGDARLTLRSPPDGAFDALVLDAFSSDAIPIHLLTREAFALYHRLLSPHGVLAVHISNRHIDLEPVVAALATDAGLVARVRRDHDFSKVEREGSGRSPSVWVVVGRSGADFGALGTDPRWTAPTAQGIPWTDDFSNVLRVLKWR